MMKSVLVATGVLTVWFVLNRWVLPALGAKT